jgi:hypothetical protein
MLIIAFFVLGILRNVIASDSVAIFDMLIVDFSIEDCFVSRNDAC